MTSATRYLAVVAALFAACSSGGGGAGVETGGGADVMAPEAGFKWDDSAEEAQSLQDTSAPDTQGSEGPPAETVGVPDPSADRDTARAQDPSASEATGDATPETTSGMPAIGSPCTAETDCPAGGSGTPKCRTDWPGGYCLVTGCAAHGHDCPGDAGLGGTQGSKCVKTPELMCLALCDSVADCREGYDCVPKPDAAGHGSVNVCYPK